MNMSDLFLLCIMHVGVVQLQSSIRAGVLTLIWLKLHLEVCCNWQRLYACGFAIVACCDLWGSVKLFSFVLLLHFMPCPNRCLKVAFSFHQLQPLLQQLTCVSYSNAVLEHVLQCSSVLQCLKA